ncbi:hypothetical protein MGN70_002784 [Eutypa lata]|nr:hypothetical protein MGN70_002784 [Eutypa lata]
MCEYSGMLFACGCRSVHRSGYTFCANRGQCTSTFTLSRWNAWCPAARKMLKGKPYKTGMRLPKCCNDLSEKQRLKLCTKCLVDGMDMSSVSRRICPGCDETMPYDPSLDPVAEFEKFLPLWPAEKKTRYLRRKEDPSEKDKGWSL